MSTREQRRVESERLLALLPQVQEELQRFAGVERVSVGLRERGGAIVRDEMVFRVHVVRKRPSSELAPGELIPASIRGVPIDVVVRRMPEAETGFNDENDSKQYRPVCGGISISADDAVPEIGATLGCICRTTDGKVVALSNWHVLIKPDGAKGKRAGQPLFRTSCCCACDVIGEILDFDQTLDCAIATIKSDIGWAPKIRRIMRSDGTVEEEGIIKGSGVPVPGDDVYKIGIRTGLTRGVVTDIHPDRVEVTPDAEFPRMSNKGDSGSVYVSQFTGLVIGLHNAGDGTRGFGIPFPLVKARLNIDVIPTPPDTHYDVLEFAADEIILQPPYDTLAARLRERESGRQLLQLMRTHRDEVLSLINHRRRVSVTWQRTQGPAWLAAFGRSAGDPAYTIPRQIDGIDRRDAVRYIGDALAANASPALAASFAEFGGALAAVLSESASADDLVRLWDDAQQRRGNDAQQRRWDDAHSAPVG